MIATATEPLAATRNACKLCAPLGACLAIRGIEGSAPFLHGSQGCATYIRRYLISHFREPMDIAVSGFSEAATVFGGGPNLHAGLNNVTRQYGPELIGIATTCLPETIGDDVGLLLRDYHPQCSAGGHACQDSGAEPAGGSRAEPPAPPKLVHVSTPSYRGTHIDGFHAAVRAAVEQLAESGPAGSGINLLPGMASPADLRYLKEVAVDFGLDATILPDYSETLDGPQLAEYRNIPPGGTPVKRIRQMARACASLEFGRTLAAANTAAGVLQARFGVERRSLGSPIGALETDRLFAVLSELSGRPVPEKHAAERGRLVDSYVDAHKYVFGRRAVVYGEEDLVVGVTSFLVEIGAQPALCASGGESGKLAETVAAVAGDAAKEIVVREGMDFAAMGELAGSLAPDFLIGGSKGYGLARQLNVPLVRVGFPIHDRVGGQRILHFGYRGAQQLFDAVTNALLGWTQDHSPVGYSYL
jgi:nitrogenase molybdenum-iron protein NifN